MSNWASTVKGRVRVCVCVCVISLSHTRLVEVSEERNAGSSVKKGFSLSGGYDLRCFFSFSSHGSRRDSSFECTKCLLFVCCLLPSLLNTKKSVSCFFFPLVNARARCTSQHTLPFLFSFIRTV